MDYISNEIKQRNSVTSIISSILHYIETVIDELSQTKQYNIGSSDIIFHIQNLKVNFIYTEISLGN